VVSLYTCYHIFSKHPLHYSNRAVFLHYNIATILHQVLYTCNINIIVATIKKETTGPLSVHLAILMSKNNNGNQKRTLLDRSIVTILPNDNADHPHRHETPSRQAGIPADEERLYRMHGTSLIAQACQHILEVPQIYPTATVLFHRFYHQVSLRDADVWSTALACTLLAAKMEEVAAKVTVRRLVLAFVHLYRRRTFLLEGDHEILQRILQRKQTVAAHPHAADWSLDQKYDQLQTAVPALSRTGPVWKEWHDAVVRAESRLLRQLGFTLYWIPDRHPHRFVPHICRVLLDKHDNPLSEAALRYCDRSCRLDLCVRYAPEVIACAAVYVALLDRQETVVIDDRKNSSAPWWHVVCGSTHDHELSIVGNALLALADAATNATRSTGDDADDVRIADQAFLKSHCEGNGSFNDPGSFVWEMLVATDDSVNNS